MTGPESSDWVLVWVKDSPWGKTYPRKKQLKQAGYHWNPEKERWEISVLPKDVNSQLSRWGFQCRCNVGTDEKQYSRSTTYRKKFLKAYAGFPEFHCAYCHRKLRVDVPPDAPDFLTVDHVISVGSVNGNPHTLLYRKINFKQAGLADINEVKNLIPSCRSCNEKKGAFEEMGKEIYGFGYRRHLEKQYAKWRQSHPEKKKKDQ